VKEYVQILKSTTKNNQRERTVSIDYWSTPTSTILWTNWESFKENEMISIIKQWVVDLNSTYLNFLKPSVIGLVPSFGYSQLHLKKYTFCLDDLRKIN